MKHTVVVAGLGSRGKIHVKGILENPGRFELAGVYDPSAEAVNKTIERFNITCPVFSSAEEMLAKTKPEILVFVTHPEIRMEYIKLGIKYKVKGISFEKPMAVSLSDAREMAALCRENGIKAIISHQQKYMKQMQQMYKCVRSGIIGEPELIRIFMRPWASQLGTHFVDYALWANGGVGAEWVVGHAHGRVKLTDDHPSPDYLFGEARLKNGATLIIESGYLAPFTMSDEEFWCNNRLTVYGQHGYAWAETNGRCAVFSPETKGKVELYQYPKFTVQQEDTQTPYYTEYADWMDNDGRKHSCNIDISLEGFEIIEGLYKSALENIRVDIPVQGRTPDAITELKKILPEQSYPEGFKDGGFYKNGLQVK
ncbi:MAG: Gfo/Idh/MocA family oxidoreductase [Treponema sp.]|jgi:predicted dehydrogenase|nr:Gfo/Idh/MocA family oxidoreductase [Treponema sp.]